MAAIRSLLGLSILTAVLGLTPLTAGAQLGVGNGDARTTGSIAISDPAGVAATAGNTGGFNTSSDSIAIGQRAIAGGTDIIGGIAIGSTSAAGRETRALADDTVAVGSNARATGITSQAYGASAQATARSAYAAGFQSVAAGQRSIAIGDNANAQSDNGVAIGDHATAVQAGSIAIGQNAFAQSSVAIGTGAQANGLTTTAIGDGAIANGSNSVALGNNSIANQANTVSVGQAGQERRITNVAPGIDGTDAVNVNQLNAVAIGGAAPLVEQLINRMDQLETRLDEVARNSNRGIAGVAAMAGAVPTTPGKTTLNLGLGAYQGESAIGASVAHLTSSGRFNLNGGVSLSGGKSVARVGAGITF